MVLDYLKTFPQFILPKHGLTSLAGVLANVKNPAVKNHLIKNFIKKYKVNMHEALQEDPTQYACFNDFFIRRLKPEARPIAKADIISPVDGFVSEIGRIDTGRVLQAKKKFYSVKQLLAFDPKSQLFEHGLFATLYLSPKDYHRVHMPVDATVEKMIYVPGKLFSVQPTTARVIPHLFARNERLVVFFDTQAGPMVMVLVGATIVGGIGTSWHGDLVRGPHIAHFEYAEPIHLEKGDEMGYFKLGSTVILLFADGENIKWAPHFKAGDPIHFGEKLGNKVKN
ncbi:phosphatidylserine decarboxylase (plasmid) [Legionella adelaidensis]|uniref:Phosphatidylserine decarboxylase proenzyme n=1 Tax=Legionella adelaidensis TaxID=45056 RepID=A0A0W0R2L1_9GAMM|nr:archaetidylserine decarboxylase [Legionella adelaidensis]KTC65331.1 phosphatidylserine decarboxylase [Legionella adelaidensis]VEH86018.1 phosphatidylserine decarboxylase [Legionella adelaidensis]